MCKRAQAHVSLVLDTKEPIGILSKTVKQSEFQLLHDLLKDLAQKYGFKLILAEYQKQQIRSKNRLQFNYPHRETHLLPRLPNLRKLQAISRHRFEIYSALGLRYDFL